MTIMTPEQKQQASLISRVDSWAQEHYKRLYKEFSYLYVGENGWEGVFELSPSRFYKAYGLALEYQDLAKKDGF